MPSDAEASSSGCPIILPTHDWAKSSFVSPTHSDMRISFARVYDYPGRAKLLLCSVPGCMSTWTRKFGNALYATMSDNGSPLRYPINLDMGDIPERAPLMRALEAMAASEVTEIACSNAWQRVAIVRNPYMRILSKFIDKVITNAEAARSKGDSYAPPWRVEDGTDFGKFIARLAATGEGDERLHSNNTLTEAMRVNGHFRSASNFCGMRYVPYTYLHQEALHTSAPSLAAKLGVNDDQRVRQVLAELRPHNACTDALRLHQFYDPPTVARVRAYYAEDFRRLRYPAHFPSIEGACRSSGDSKE